MSRLKELEAGLEAIDFASLNVWEATEIRDALLLKLFEYPQGGPVGDRDLLIRARSATRDLIGYLGLPSDHQDHYNARLVAEAMHRLVIDLFNHQDQKHKAAAKDD